VKKLLFGFLLLFLAFRLEAAPLITVQASAVTILGTNQSISITVQLIDPGNTGMLRVSGTGIVPVMRAVTVTPGATATVGPIYGNDVIVNALGNANSTYYQVSVYTVSAAGIIAATPSLQNFYAFAGSGTIDLVNALPILPNAFNTPTGVLLPGSLSVAGASTFTGAVTTSKFNTVLYVDGTKYPLTVTGVNQAITDANAAGGGMVMITQPMNVNANIVLQTGVHVQCSGWASAPLTWTGGSGPNSFFFASQVTDIGVHWCRMIGPNLTTAGTADIRGIEIDGTSRHNFSYNKITGVSYGVFDTGASGNPGNDGVIDHNWIQTATVQGIATFTNDSRTTFNRIDTVGTTNQHHGIYVSGGRDNVVQGNQISNVQGFCVHANTSTTGQNDEDTKIIGNGCNTAGQAVSGARGGILVGFAATATFNRKATVVGNTVETIGGDRCIGITDATDVTITANTCRNIGAADGILVNAPTNGISKFVVSKNIIDTSTGGNGIKVVSTAAVSNGSIEGNVIDTVQQEGILLAGASNTIVAENVVNNYNTNNSSNNCLDSNGAKNIIKGNICSSTQATGFGVNIGASATDNVVMGNQLFGNGGAINDTGTRTMQAGNKINNTDAVFRVNAGIAPSTAGSGDAGTTALPFGNLWLGTAATNNFKFQPAATAAARTISIADPLGNTSLPLTIASGTKALNTASITTATCDAGAAATATGTLSTDTVDWSFNAAPSATNKYGAFLVVYAVPSANTVTFFTCNPSATTSTPTAMTVNWSVRRP
jgi:hypothetical protein